jgi:hypothetical protein
VSGHGLLTSGISQYTYSIYLNTGKFKKKKERRNVTAHYQAKERRNRYNSYLILMEISIEYRCTAVYRLSIYIYSAPFGVYFSSAGCWCWAGLHMNSHPAGHKWTDVYRERMRTTPRGVSSIYSTWVHSHWRFNRYSRAYTSLSLHRVEQFSIGYIYFWIGIFIYFYR